MSSRKRRASQSKPPDQKKKTTEVLEGPVSLSLHESKEFKKVVYVFGDVHKRQSACAPDKKKQTVNDFFREIFEANAIADPHRIIDLFLEIGLISKHRQEHALLANRLTPDLERGFLAGDVLATFRDCLTLSKEACLWKNVRAHYVDARTYFFEFWTLIQLCIWYANSKLVQLWRSERKEEEPDLAERRMKTVSEMVADMQRDILTFESRANEVHIENVRQLFEEMRISKQWANIREPVLRETIQSYFTKMLEDPERRFTRERMSDTRAKIFKLLESPEVGKFVQTQGRTSVQDFKAVERIILEANDILYQFFARFLIMFSANFLDAYLMGRLFRSFNGGPDVHYAVIYVGEFHANHIRGLLDLLRFQRVQEVSSPGQCIDMAAFNQPFFLQVVEPTKKKKSKHVSPTS